MVMYTHSIQARGMMVIYRQDRKGLLFTVCREAFQQWPQVGATATHTSSYDVCSVIAKHTHTSSCTECIAMTAAVTSGWCCIADVS
jgi:hypothetical protein